jgi:hypothetical protein
MRRVLTALATLIFSTSVVSVTMAAGAESYSVCLAGGSNDALRCDYASLEQCRATASGGLGVCIMNPAAVSKAFASYSGAGRLILDRHQIR